MSIRLSQTKYKVLCSFMHKRVFKDLSLFWCKKIKQYNLFNVEYPHRWKKRHLKYASNSKSIFWKATIWSPYLILSLNRIKTPWNYLVFVVKSVLRNTDVWYNQTCSTLVTHIKQMSMLTLFSLVSMVRITSRTCI